jgi:hypothetical protein
VKAHAVALTLFGIAIAPRIALGQSTPGEADRLYQGGQTLLAAGELDQACSAFRASAKIDPALGAILSVAYCDEKQGRPATAWSEYALVARRAHERGQAEREKFALGRARALEVNVTHVHLSVAPPSARVTVDGQPAQFVDEKTLLVPPGSHTITVVVGEERPWSRDIQLGEMRESPDPSYVVGAPVAGSISPEPPVPPPTRGAAQRDAGIAAAAVGVAGVVVGTIFGIKTLGISGRCPNKTMCPEADIDSATTSGIVSDVGFGVGVAGLALGAWLFLSAPRGPVQTTAWRLSFASASGGPGFVVGRSW